MTLRTVLLTTDTPHHRYFAHEIAANHPWTSVIVETGCLRPPFETAHPFERERDEYERTSLLGGSGASFTDVAPVVSVDAINSSEALAAVSAAQPDVTIVFGTRKLAPALIALAGRACLNLHGGDPEEYRGLDTHLWAIYHNDFTNLVTTLHHVDHGIDTGMRVARLALPVARGMKLYQLRAVNTLACVQLVSPTLDGIAAGRPPAGVALTHAGRYYSFMPAVLKTECVRKFERHTAAL